MSLPLMGFPGTISLRPSTLLAVLEDILSSLHNHGFRRILIINGHGGNIASISSAVHTVSRSLANLRVKHFEWWMDTEAYKAALEKMDRQAGSHASLGETSFMMAVRPSAVYMQELTGRDAPDLPSREFTTVQTFAVKYPDGIMGLDPRHADRSTGEALLHKSAEICARELEEWS